MLARRGILGPLHRGARHPKVAVRRLCLGALAGAPGDEILGLLPEAVSDADPQVRCLALREWARRAPLEAAEPVNAALRDPDPNVRATAASASGPEGLGMLREMLASPRVADAVAALTMVPPTFSGEVRIQLRSQEPRCRRAALERVATWPGELSVPRDELAPFLEAPDLALRCLAVQAMSRAPDRAALDVVASALGDPSSAVRRAAREGLVARELRGVAAVRPRLRDASEPTAAGALQVAAADAGMREALLVELRHHTEALWLYILSHPLLPAPETVASRFLRIAFADAILRSRRLAFLVLELLEGPEVVRRIERALRFGTSRLRGDALEVLSNLGDRDTARLLVLAHETGPLEERSAALGGLMTVPASLGHVLEVARTSNLRWVRTAAEAATNPTQQTPEEVRLMEQLLALKQVPLFVNLSLDHIEAIQRRSVEASYLPGEVIVREGDLGGELYLLLEGVVEVYLGYETPDQQRVAVLEAVDYFGEMAIFDDAPRSAAVVAREQTRVLVLDGGSFKELITEAPEISFEIFRVLTARVRAAERRGATR